MNLVSVIENKNFGSNQKELEELYQFYQLVGDRVESGYLGSSIDNIQKDENGKLFVSTQNLSGSCYTKSKTTLLDHSFLVQQIQEKGDQKYYQLFSWDKSGEKYTYVEFDNEESLNSCCNGIRKYVSDPLGVQVETIMRQLQIPKDHIMNVKINQSSPNVVQNLITSESKDTDELNIRLL